METIDAGLGMMYGTILAPVLIISGYDPLLVVPSILLSQAIGGVFATYSHNKYKNAVWNIKSHDLKIAFVIVIFGLIAVGLGVFVGNIISSTYLKTYIGILCIIMGILVLIKHKFKFSWKKITILGLISSFNKALSGGGFGPIVATGNIASGVKEKNSIGITDFAEAPICLASFGIWTYFNGFPDTPLLLPLCIGASFGGLIGPMLLSKVSSKTKIKIAIGVLALVSGIYMLLQTWVL